MKKRIFRDYQEKLIEDLRDPELAIAYLNVSLADEDPRIFLMALKNVYEAQGVKMTKLAEKTQLSRENLYRILSNKGNPKLINVVSLLQVAGFTLAVQPSKR